MRGFILFLLFGMGVFALSLIGNKKYQTTTLYALAIGGVVNANYFDAVSHPIDCFGLPFGIDSVIYTLFVFAVMVVLLKDTKKDAYLLAISSIVAIMFSALMELFAELLANGSTVAIWVTFLTFAASALGSAVAVIPAVEIVARLKKKHSPYLCMAVGICIMTIINGAIDFPLTALVTSTPIQWVYVGTSFAGKGTGLVYSLIMLKILNTLKKKNH